MEQQPPDTIVSQALCDHLRGLTESGNSAIAAAAANRLTQEQNILAGLKARDERGSRRLPKAA